MNLKRYKRVIRRYINETLLDFRNKDYVQILHSIKIFPKQILLKYPRNISIEPINSCNLSCEFCSSPPELIERPLRGMKYEEFAQTIDKIKDYTHHIWLFLAGEPFLNPKFPEMVKYATENNLHTTTSSNANLIDKSISRRIVESGLDKLIISLDGTSQDIYNQMRRGGEYQKVINAVKYLNKEKEKQGKLKPIIELQFINSKINEHQAGEFEKISKELNVDYAVKSLGIPTWIFDEQKCDQLAEKYLPTKGKKRYDNNKELKRDFVCSNVQRSFILSDGTMCICCYDIKGKYKMGNIFEDDFMQVWKSKRYVNTREMMEKRKLPLCNICGETNEL